MRVAAPSLSQRAFAQALLDPQQPCPPGLRSWNGSDPAARFAVHRNNAVSSLVAALADTFPVTRELVGEAFFAAMARLFVMGAPPRSPMLALYGDGFPDFVESFAPARRVPYLADVARLEVHRVRAFHAADAPVLSADDLARHPLDHEALPASRVNLHPSAAVLTSRFAIVALWAAHQDAGDIAEVDPRQPQSALVLRQHEDVAVIAIARGSALFFQRLMAGAPLGEASAAAMACADGFDLAASLGILIRHGALNAWHEEPREPQTMNTIARWIRAAIALCERIPRSLIALLARFSIAAVFWKSGQTKIEGLKIDIVDGTFNLGWPRLADSAIELFRDEYKVPLIAPEIAAPFAAAAEHTFPLLLLIGLATRLSALGLLVMTAVIQIFVYPDAYPTHGVWAAVLLYLVARGPGAVSIDRWIARRWER